MRGDGFLINLGQAEFHSLLFSHCSGFSGQLFKTGPNERHVQALHHTVPESTGSDNYTDSLNLKKNQGLQLQPAGFQGSTPVFFWHFATSSFIPSALAVPPITLLHHSCFKIH